VADQVVVRCPVCSLKYRIDPVHVGRRARCKQCQAVFRIESEQPLNDDTIVAWITNDDPSSQSVQGGTGIFDQTDAGQTHAGEPVPGAEVEGAGEPRVRLRKLNSTGAVFEFSAAALRSDDVRNAMPRACVGCARREELHVHLVHWPEEMISDERDRWAELVDRPIGHLDRYKHGGDRDLLLELPESRHKREPYTRPFPVFACEACRVSKSLQTRVVSRPQGVVCRLLLRSLEAAVEFFRNNGGEGTTAFQRLVALSEHRRDAWHQLESSVRRRIASWYVPENAERFVLYVPPALLPIAEHGTAGLIVTTRRLVLKTRGEPRSFSLQERGRLELTKKDDNAIAHIYGASAPPTAFRLDWLDADTLIDAVKKLHAPWTLAS
jgi:hypothetical protein